MSPRALITAGWLAALALSADLPRDLQALDSPSRTERERAAAKLRASLTTSDVAACLAAARTGGPRTRASIVEILLDRHDLSSFALASAGALDDALLDEIVRAAFVRARPDAEEPALDADATWDRLHRSLGDTDELQGSGTRLDLDALAYETRWARALPFPLLVDPSAPARAILIPRRVLSAESLILGAIQRSGVPAYACGGERGTSRTAPAFVLLGGAPEARGGDRAAAWMRAWRGANRDAAIRGGTALLALAVTPVDAAIVAELRAQAERAALAYDVVQAVPLRGAASLGADREALAGFVRLATRGDGPMQARVRRVLVSLPRRDALNASIDAQLVQALESCAPSRKEGLLDVLARRRSEAAGAAFRAAARADDAAARATGLAGLHAIDDPDALRAAVEALSKSDDARVLRAAVRILAVRPPSSDDAAPLLESATGARRASIVAAMLASTTPATVQRAVGAIASVREPSEIEVIASAARRVARGPERRALAEAFASKLPNASASARIVAAISKLVPEAQVAPVRESLQRDASPPLLGLRLRALARLEPPALAANRLLEVAEGKDATPADRAAALRALRDLLHELSVFERATVRSAVAARLAAAVRRAGQDGNEVEMDAAIELDGASNRAESFPRGDVADDDDDW